MTPIQTITIPLAEVPSIDIVCRNCKSLTRLYLPRTDVPEVFACCGCNKQLWYHDDTSRRLLNGLMRTLSEYVSKAEGLPFSLSFSLDDKAR